MKRVLFLAFWLTCHFMQAQSAKVVQLEHSLRWATELNFPNFLEDAAFEEMLLDEIGDRLSAKLELSDIEFPGHFDYRLISMFGKTKIKFPKSNAPVQIAMTSSITRATVGYSMLWSMQVIIKKNGKTILDKEVEHEIEPYSMSIRMSTKPWLDAAEFSKVLLLLLDECLGNLQYREGVIIELGSMEMVRREIEKIIPIANEYTLAVAGSMMTESNSKYQLLKDTLVLHDFIYRDKVEWDLTPAFAPQAIFPSIFSRITGIEMYYSLESKQRRLGTLTTSDGIERRLRLDWLAELEKSTMSDETTVGRVLSPITGQFYEKDSLISHFILYSKHRLLEMSFNDAHFQQGEGNFMETEYTIIGDFRNRSFVVIYHEGDSRVLITIEGEKVAVLSLINSNPESLSAGGVRLTKNKRFIVGTGNTKKPTLEVGSAEWYPLYTIEAVDDAAATEMSFILMLLFFAVGQTG